MLPLGDSGLHPRLTRGNEDHLVEFELLLNLARRDQVAVVNRVEGATHDTDACTSLCWLGHAGRRT